MKARACLHCYHPRSLDCVVQRCADCPTPREYVRKACTHYKSMQRKPGTLGEAIVAQKSRNIP